MTAKTASVMVQTLCVPCQCHCRYCLLSWNGRTTGADYARSEAYARRFHDWLQLHHPEVHFHFCFGYSMDHPDLIHAVDFQNSIGSVSGKVLMMNGMKFRSEAETDLMMKNLRAHGLETVNFTFYGYEPYHDAFAGRNGDFRYLLVMLKSAMHADLNVTCGIPVTKENVTQINELIELLQNHGVKHLRLFVPHEEGRGENLCNIRISEDDLTLIRPEYRCFMNRVYFRTEREWYMDQNLNEDGKRSLLISLTTENIDWIEAMPFEDIIHETEQMDETYYDKLPSFRKMLDLYGSPDDSRLYGARDLYQHYQRVYIKDHGLHLRDVIDERYCGSRRFD
ncbi:MAG: hypothetical protein VZT48_00840 [Bulleidia sp.]|nr:hypothetical protein [Bulleidia sp.]